jgi:hypothetical protein
VVGGKPQRCMSRGIADTCIPYVSRMYPACIRIPHARYMYPNVSDMYPKFILDSFGIRVKYMQNIKIEKFVLSHRTVPNEAGDHRAASGPPLGRGRTVGPPLRATPTSITANTARAIPHTMLVLSTECPESYQH